MHPFHQLAYSLTFYHLDRFLGKAGPVYVIPYWTPRQFNSHCFCWITNPEGTTVFHQNWGESLDDYWTRLCKRLLELRAPNQTFRLSVDRPRLVTYPLPTVLDPSKDVVAPPTLFRLAATDQYELGKWAEDPILRKEYPGATLKEGFEEMCRGMGMRKPLVIVKWELVEGIE